MLVLPQSKGSEFLGSNDRTLDCKVILRLYES